MNQNTESARLSLLANEAGYEPIEDRLRASVRASIEAMFEEKVTDIVGLYLDPPERAVVLCVDEKAQIQALDRTRPELPLKRACAATMTHDYKRPRHAHAVRGARREVGQGDRRMPAASQD